MAQRVREEGATLFQGFSFERPSLLQRRRSRPTEDHTPAVRLPSNCAAYMETDRTRSPRRRRRTCREACRSRT